MGNECSRGIDDKLHEPFQYQKHKNPTSLDEKWGSQFQFMAPSWLGFTGKCESHP
jgi:hypothetical protein